MEQTDKKTHHGEALTVSPGKPRGPATPGPPPSPFSPRNPRRPGFPRSPRVPVRKITVSSRHKLSQVISFGCHCYLTLEKNVYLCLLWSLAGLAPRPTHLTPVTPVVLVVPALPWVRRPALHRQAHLLVQGLPVDQRDREGREDPSLHCFLSGRRVPMVKHGEEELVGEIIGAGILSCTTLPCPPVMPPLTIVRRP